MDGVKKRLGEMAEIISGLGDDRHHEGACSYLYYQPNNLTDIEEPSPLTTIFRKEPISEKQIVRSGDVMIKRLNHDRAYLAAEINTPATISQNLFLIRALSGSCLPEYLAFLFEQQEILSQITQVSGSSAPIRALSAKMLFDISIPIKSIETQRIIGGIWKLGKRRKLLLRKLESENDRLIAAIYNKYIGKEVG